MDLKGKDILFKLGEGSPEEIVFKKTPPLDFTKKQFLPRILHLISRKYTILSELDGNWHDREKKVLKDLAQELWNNWIHMNVPPIQLKNVELKLDKLFKQVTKLKKTIPSKRGPTWIKEMQKLKSELQNGFDIRSFHQASIDLLANEYDIEFGVE